MSRDSLSKIYSRLNRAEELAQSIADGFDVQLEVVVLPNGHGFQLKAHGIDKATEKAGHVLSECVQHLRASLDNAIFALACLKETPPPKPQRLKFPIYSDERKFAQETRVITEQIPDQFADAIRQLQPFSTGDNALTLLAEISNADKHHLPISMTFTDSALDFKMNIAFQNEQDAVENHPRDKVFCLPMLEDTVFFEWKTKGPIENVEVDINSQITPWISLSNGSHKVLVALGAWCFYVRKSLDFLASNFAQPDDSPAAN